MKLLSPLYDKHNEKYPIFHSGVLAFIITTGIPLNLGFTKLPFYDTFLILLAGFFSLFMIARNEGVGQSLLSHLRVPLVQKDHIKIKQELETKSKNLQDKMPVYEGRIHHIQDPFNLLQNIVEHNIITHDENLDLPTMIKLHDIHRRLETASSRLVNYKK